MNIADLRKSYEKAELSETASHADPMKQFDQWLTEAISGEVPEPNAMTLATVGANLRPSTRIVLIKGYDARGIVWYTNYHSHKGRELAGNPYGALQFHWVEMERVVRIEGLVEKVSDAESDAVFPQPPAGQPHWSLGQPAERSDRKPHRAGPHQPEWLRAPFPVQISLSGTSTNARSHILGCGTVRSGDSMRALP